MEPTKQLIPADDWSRPKIDIRIPFEPKGRLGKDYNRIMNETRQKWVLFLDQDILILNPCWYAICQEAIKKYPDAGIFTAYTNRCGCRFSRLDNAPSRDHSMVIHKKFAHDLFLKNKYSVTLIDAEKIPDKINGFFMMTSRVAWEKAGKFRATEMFGEDTEYHRRMIRCGLKCYRIDGIYVFHFPERAEGTWIPGIKTSKEYWDEFKKRRDDKKNRLHGHSG